jgi:hypothetical protein
VTIDTPTVSDEGREIMTFARFPIPRGTFELLILKAMRSRVLHVVGMVLFAAGAVAAHHSFSAEYDGTAKVTVKGVVSKVEWSNPHVHIYVDVKDERGNVTTWDAEGTPPNALQRRGLTRDVLNVGDTVTLTGFRARDDSTRVSRFDVTTEDGRKYTLGGAGEFQPLR